MIKIEQIRFLNFDKRFKNIGFMAFFVKNWKFLRPNYQGKNRKKMIDLKSVLLKILCWFNILRYESFIKSNGNDNDTWTKVLVRLKVTRGCIRSKITKTSIKYEFHEWKDIFWKSLSHLIVFKSLSDQKCTRVCFFPIFSNF